MGFALSLMTGRFKFAVVASSTCLVVLLLFGAVRGRGRSRRGSALHAQLGVYTDVLSHIKADYVEEPDMKAVTIGAINGMLEALDPFASYLNADQYKQYQKGTRHRQRRCRPDAGPPPGVFDGG